MQAFVGLVHSRPWPPPKAHCRIRTTSAEPRGPGAIDATVVVRAPSSGFDVGDALIGLAGGMGLALLITGSVILLASQRNKTRIA